MRNLRRIIWLGAGLAAVAALAAFAVEELQTSRLQSALWSGIARDATFSVEAGPSDAIRFPGAGPYDQRLGYRKLPEHIGRLQAQGYVVTSQARMSRRLIELSERGLFVPYREKNQAGLTLLDCRAEPLLQSRVPQRAYERFEAVPPLLVDALLFVEDRHLLGAHQPHRNPAIDPERLARAVLEQMHHTVDATQSAAGGSTLATQIEKYRHSPHGHTDSAGEKLRQMASASLRAYLDGEDTLPRRRQIVVDYLNTVPLAARPGFGEAHGLGDGLWAWYGRDFGEVNRLLADSGEGAAPTGDALRRQATTFKQALSLMIAQRRPAQYLLGNSERLARLTDSYLRLMADAGVVAPALRDAALRSPLRLQVDAPPAPRPDYVQRKAVSATRTSLSALLEVPRAYDLDRLDLDVQTSLDGKSQELATRLLKGLKTPAAAKAAGLYGTRLLADGADLNQLVFSFTLFERGARESAVDSGRQHRSAVRRERGCAAGPRLDRQAAHLDHLPRDRRRAARALGRLDADRPVGSGAERSRPARGVGETAPLARRRSRPRPDARGGAGSNLLGEPGRGLFCRWRAAPLRELRARAQRPIDDGPRSLQAFSQSGLHPPDARHRSSSDVGRRC